MLFTLNTLLVLIFKFLSLIFGHIKKRLDQKVNFKIYDVRTWLTNNCNTNINQYFKKQGNQVMKFGQLIEYKMMNIFLEKSYTKCDGETISRTFFKRSKLSVSLD